MKSSLLAAASLLPGACIATPPPPVVSARAVSAEAAGRAVADAAAQVRRCYRDPAVPTAAKRIVTHLRVRYSADGTLIGLPAFVSQEGVTAANQAYADRMAEAASVAVVRCAPLHLPAGLHKGGWDEFDLVFGHAQLA